MMHQGWNSQMDKRIINKINSDGRKINIMYDFSNLMYRAAFSSQRQLLAKGYKDWGIFKHKCISEIISFKANFNNPNVIICFDRKDKNVKYWRHDISESYKGNRKKAASAIPKKVLYENFKEIRHDVQEYLPWKVVVFAGAEADDTIGVLCKEYPNEINVIVSPDKDFQQLQSNPNVYQYCTMKHIFIECKDPRKFLFEHLISGDAGDCIPNIFSDADTLINPVKKQKILRKTKLAEMWDLYQMKGLKSVSAVYFVDKIKDRFIENRKMIDLSMIPDNIKKSILSEYKNFVPQGTPKKFWEYCNKNRLVVLSEAAELL